MPMHPNGLRRRLCALALAAALLGAPACRFSEQESPSPAAPAQRSGQVEPSVELQPPTPPLRESFEAPPQISLFPWIGDFQPEPDDTTRRGYWKAYREHLFRTSGPVVTDPQSRNTAFSFRALKGVDSLGVFSPLAVEPGHSYAISLRIKTGLPEGATAGLGISEFSQFLWIPEQYTQETARNHFLGAQEMFRLGKTAGWETRQLRFTAGPRTRMIHLVFFREGPADRSAVFLDDISVAEIR